MFMLLGGRSGSLSAISFFDMGVVLGAFLLLLVPHLDNLPPGFTSFIVCLVVYRFYLTWSSRAIPGKWAKGILVIIGLVVLWLNFRWQFTVISAVSFFILSISLKLFELRAYRDLYVYILLLLYFSSTAFLFSQTLLLVFYQFFCVFWVLYLMVRINTDDLSISRKKRFGKVGVLLVQSVPVMLVLFLFFPRIAPLWSVPLSSGQAKTGISDKMAPGDISQLAQSDEVAFRAEFVGPIPKKSELYWRGIILDQFDGREWSSSERPLDYLVGKLDDVRLEKRVSPHAYRVIMLPTEKRWAFGLKDSVPASSNIELSEDGLLRFRHNIFQTTLYQADIAPVTGDVPTLSPSERRRYTLIPRFSNPEARTWAYALYQKVGGQPEEYLQAILTNFRTESFRYTLNPPGTGENMVDDFLFRTKSGFCAHYAGSYAFLARLIGVPARVMVGYQGGEVSTTGDYLVVHQFDAHAWVELWFPARGWIRVDPTAHVAPQRIESGIREAVREEGSFLKDNTFSPIRYDGIRWVRWLRWQLDEVNYTWQKWVVEYNEDLQQSILKNWFKNSSLMFMAGMLAGLSALVFVLLFMVSYLRQEVRTKPPEIRLWQRMLHKLQRIGVPVTVQDGPLSVQKKLEDKFPQLADAFRAFSEDYIDAVYRNHSADVTKNTRLQRLKRSARQAERRLRRLAKANRMS